MSNPLLCAVVNRDRIKGGQGKGPAGQLGNNTKRSKRSCLRKIILWANTIHLTAGQFLDFQKNRLSVGDTEALGGSATSSIDLQVPDHGESSSSDDDSDSDDEENEEDDGDDKDEEEEENKDDEEEDVKKVLGVQKENGGDFD